MSAAVASPRQPGRGDWLLAAASSDSPRSPRSPSKAMLAPPGRSAAAAQRTAPRPRGGVPLMGLALLATLGLTVLALAWHGASLRCRGAAQSAGSLAPQLVRGQSRDPQPQRLRWPSFEELRDWQPQEAAGGGSGVPHGGGVSVVLLNWARPEQVRQILDAYTQPEYDGLVAEVVLLHLRPEAHFEYPSHPRVRVVTDFAANRQFGLASRMLGCMAAASDEVVLQDDDVLLQPLGFRRLAKARAAAEHSAQIIGFRGRSWDLGLEPRYIASEAAPGPQPIALTIALATHKSNCAAFLRLAPAVDDLVAHSTPLWNGEDVWLSFVSFKQSCAMPRILSGAWPRSAAPQAGLNYFPKDEAAMHARNQQQHFAYRDMFTREAARRLGVYQPDSEAPGCGRAGPAAR